jgi:hypothetical protein
VKVRNDSGKDITLTISHNTKEWKQGESIELTEGEWSLIMGDTTREKESARQYWRGLFPDSLPRFIPYRKKEE